MRRGSVMSRAWAQCSANLVVARAMGLRGAAAHGSACCGSALRNLSSAARLATRQRSKTTAGAARSARIRRSMASSSDVASRSKPAAGTPGAVAMTTSSLWARCSTTSQTLHPRAPDGDSHAASSSSERKASMACSSAARSSKTSTTEGYAAELAHDGLQYPKGVAADDGAYLVGQKSGIEQRGGDSRQVLLASVAGHVTGHAIHVGADRQMLDACHIGNVTGVGHEVGHGAHAPAHRAVRPQSNHPASGCDGAQLVVGQVPREVLDGAGAAV